jgi:hypothetical protein
LGIYHIRFSFLCFATASSFVRKSILSQLESRQHRKARHWWACQSTTERSKSAPQSDRRVLPTLSRSGKLIIGKWPKIACSVRESNSAPAPG